MELKTISSDTQASINQMVQIVQTQNGVKPTIQTEKTNLEKITLKSVKNYYEYTMENILQTQLDMLKSQCNV